MGILFDTLGLNKRNSNLGQQTVDLTQISVKQILSFSDDDLEKYERKIKEELDELISDLEGLENREKELDKKRKSLLNSDLCSEKNLFLQKKDEIGNISEKLDQMKSQLKYFDNLTLVISKIEKTIFRKNCFFDLYKKYSLFFNNRNYFIIKLIYYKIKDNPQKNQTLSENLSDFSFNNDCLKYKGLNIIGILDYPNENQKFVIDNIKNIHKGFELKEVLDYEKIDNNDGFYLYIDNKNKRICIYCLIKQKQYFNKINIENEIDDLKKKIADLENEIKPLYKTINNFEKEKKDIEIEIKKMNKEKKEIKKKIFNTKKSIEQIKVEKIIRESNKRKKKKENNLLDCFEGLPINLKEIYEKGNYHISIQLLINYITTNKKNKNYYKKIEKFFSFTNEGVFYKGYRIKGYINNSNFGQKNKVFKGSEEIEIEFFNSASIKNISNLLLNFNPFDGLNIEILEILGYERLYHKRISGTKYDFFISPNILGGSCTTISTIGTNGYFPAIEITKIS